MVELQGQVGGRDGGNFCGLISAVLTNSLSAIPARALFDLSGIFCMFGFYLNHVLFKIFAVYILLCLSPLLHTQEIQ